MEIKTYEYTAFSVRTEGKAFRLEIEDYKKATFEQMKLFNAMINFGYIAFNEGILKLNDKDIVNFWNYAKDSVLKTINLKEYYSILSISEPYSKQIPTIKEKETFVSDSYNMTVVWTNDTTIGKMATAPKAYTRVGLELFNFDDDNIGSLYPEYYELYELVDKADKEWKTWSKNKRYDFLKGLKEESYKRKFIIPNQLIQALEHIANK